MEPQHFAPWIGLIPGEQWIYGMLELAEYSQSKYVEPRERKSELFSDQLLLSF